MVRKSKNPLNQLLRLRGGIGSAVVVIVLLLIGFVSPTVRDQVASVLHLPLPDVATDPDKPLPSKKQSPLKEGVWTVVRVADGDTLDVGSNAGTKYRIRLIGADTPETVKPNTPVQPFGPEASAFTKQKIAEANNQVRVAFDGDQIDKYGRNLAMIYLQMPNGKEVWLNELLVREGLARAQLQYRFSEGAKSALRRAEEEAKTAKRNLWSIRP
jgi:micrococcal nuclease